MKKTIINIGRQFGSGGGFVAQAIGRTLGIKVWDNDLITKSAEESGFSKELFAKSDESRSLFSMSSFFASWNLGRAENYVDDTALFKIQSEVIRKIAEEGSAIFVGRCSDYILRDLDCLDIFVTAPLPYRIERVARRENMTKEEAEELIKRKDRTRETKKRMHSLRSLRTAYTLLVLLILVSAGLITASVYIILYSLDFIPPSALTPLKLPVIVIISCMLFGTLLAVFVGKLFINPLRRLIAANEEIRQGNFKVRLSEQTVIGELNNLMRSFNSMADELEATELFRNDFINSFSHEFKTPIVSIRGFARQLQRDNEKHTLTDAQRREYTDIIAYEADRLARLSSNILTLTKFENQQIVTDKTEFYLDEQIRRTVLLLEKQWTAREVTIELKLEEIRYNFNEEMLAQMWLNLLGNAIKFSHIGGTVLVRCRKKNGFIRVDISDSGEGMEEETLHRIFDKFYQSDSSHKSEGNGLGLAIVKRIAELANAEITVKSEAGKGTTFSVSLPPAVE